MDKHRRNDINGSSDGLAINMSTTCLSNLLHRTILIFIKYLLPLLFSEITLRRELPDDTHLMSLLNLGFTYLLLSLSVYRS